MARHSLIPKALPCQKGNPGVSLVMTTGASQEAVRPLPGYRNKQCLCAPAPLSMAAFSLGSQLIFTGQCSPTADVFRRVLPI